MRQRGARSGSASGVTMWGFGGLAAAVAGAWGLLYTGGAILTTIHRQKGGLQPGDGVPSPPMASRSGNQKRHQRIVHPARQPW